MKLFKLALVFFTSVSLFAQDIQLKKSEIFKDTKKNSNLSFSLEDDDGNLVIIRSFYAGLIPKLKGYYIQQFDADLKLKNETELEAKDNRLRNAFIKDGKLHLIEFDHGKKDDLIQFNALSADLSDLKFSRKELLSFSEDNIRTYFGVGLGVLFVDNFSKIDANHMGEVAFSSSDNFFVINFDFKSKENDVHKVFVFNSTFDKVFERKITRDVKDKYFEYNSIDVDDNDGTVYFLGKTFENKSRKSKKGGDINYHFNLYKVNAEGQKMTSFKQPDHFISSLELLKSDDMISAIGFYGSKDDFRYNGVCLFNMDDESLNFTTKKFTPFSDEFLSDKYGNKEGKKARKKKKGISDIDFKSLFQMNNGDIILNAEEFYITTVTSTNSNGAVTTRTVYNFDDIMSIKLDAEGNLIWSRNVNKRQTGFSNSSFTSIASGEKSYFFINCSDNIKKNKLGNLYFRNTSAKKSNLYAITIDNDGEIDYNKLIDDKESKVYYRVNNGTVNLNKKTVTLLGKKKKNTRILKIKI